MPRRSSYTPEVSRGLTVEQTGKINTENTFGILNRLQGQIDSLKRISNLALLIDGSNQMLADLHLNGFNLDLDVDRDTYLGTDGDDHVELVMAGPAGQFDITINGVDDFTFTADSFNVLSGSHILMADDTWIGLSATTGRLYFDSSPTPDEMRLVLMNLDLNNNDIVFDTDGDTYIHASADDVVTLVLATAAGEFKIDINGAEDFNFQVNTFNVLAGSHIEMADDTWIGATAGAQIEFDYTPAVDEINFLNCNSGWGISVPTTVIHIYRNDALTTPQHLIEQDDTGDAAYSVLLTGGAQYSWGIDNSSTGDLFCLNAGATAGVANHFQMNTTGEIGMGVAPSVTAQLNLKRIQTGVTVNQTCFNTELDLTFNNALTSMENMFLTARYRGTQNITGDVSKGLGAACFNVFNYATAGTVDRAYGFRTDLRNLSTGTITSLMGLWGGYAANSGGGTVNYYYGAKIENYPVGTSWNAAFQSHFNIDASKNWAFYGAGTAPSRFLGRLDIDSDTYSIQLGDGQDMSMYYDGTYGQINSSLIAASDIRVTCGANKTIALQNTVYEDLQFTIHTGKVPSSNYPTWETFTANTSAYAFSVDDYIDCESNELPHYWKETTAGHLHLHFSIKTAQSTGANRYAKFTIWLAMADMNEVFAETPYTAEYTIPTGTAALTHLYLDMGDITLTNYKIGAQVIPRVKRIAATGGTEYADDVYIHQVGIHLEKDTMGSRNEITK